MKTLLALLAICEVKDSPHKGQVMRSVDSVFVIPNNLSNEQTDFRLLKTP